MPSLPYLKLLWCSWYEKAKEIDHQLNIQLGKVDAGIMSHLS